MRNTVFLRSLLIGSFCLFPSFGDMLRRRRRAQAGLRQLDRMEGYMLRDIGLTRADLHDLARLARDVDFVTEFERRRDARADRPEDEA